MFTLDKSVKNIKPMNLGVKDYNWLEVDALQGGNGTQFAGKDLEFSFTNEDNQWTPAPKIYFRLRGLLEGIVSTGPIVTRQLVLADAIAPAMNFVANLIQKIKVMYGGKKISDMDDLFPQADTLITRMERPNHWLKAMGATINFWDADFLKRVNDVSSDGWGYTNEERTYTTLASVGLPADLQVQIVANTVGTSYSHGIVTSVGGSTIPDIRTIFKVGDSITSAGGTWLIQGFGTNVGATPTIGFLTQVQANVAAENVSALVVRKTVKVSRRAKGWECVWTPNIGFFRLTKHYLPMGKYRVIVHTQPKATYKYRAIESLAAKTPETNYQFTVSEFKMFVPQMRGPKVSQGPFLFDFKETKVHQRNIALLSTGSQESFQISESTTGITVAFQHNGAGENSIYPASKFTLGSSFETKLTRLQVSFAGENKPDIISDLEFGQSGLLDHYQQRYASNALYTGRYFRDPESFEDWITRGPYFHFEFPRDGSSKSNKLTVRYGFTGTTTDGTLDAAGTMLIFEHKRFIVDGRIDGLQVRVNEVRER